MKNYADLYSDSPRAFLSKLEEDIKAIESRMARLDKVVTTSVGSLLAEYERLSLLVEQKAYGVPLAASWRWAALDGPKVANMYAAELLPDGRWFSWTGPAPATTFVAPVVRDEPLQLRISFMKTIEPEMQEALVVSVDGTPVKHHVVALDIIATIPARSSPIPVATQIELSTQATASPGAGSDRLLGIALYEVEVLPTAPEAAHE